MKYMITAALALCLVGGAAAAQDHDRGRGGEGRPGGGQEHRGGGEFRGGPQGFQERGFRGGPQGGPQAAPQAPQTAPQAPAPQPQAPRFEGRRGFGGGGEFRGGGPGAREFRGGPQGFQERGFRGGPQGSPQAAPQAPAPQAAPQPPAPRFEGRQGFGGGERRDFRGREEFRGGAPAPGFQGGPDRREQFRDRREPFRDGDRRGEFRGVPAPGPGFRGPERGPESFRPGFYLREHGWRGGRTFRVAPYRYPAGWGYRHWAFGAFLPFVFLAPDYTLYDYWVYGLPAPPPGYHWIRVGPDALLVRYGDGYVLDAVYGIFY
jgi:Ni/Co efflux regulator RcnB